MQNNTKNKLKNLYWKRLLIFCLKHHIFLYNKIMFKQIQVVIQSIIFKTIIAVALIRINNNLIKLNIYQIIE